MADVMLMDGKKMAARVENVLRGAIARSHKTPSLGILLVGDDPASLRYVRTKQKFGEKLGILVDLKHFSKKDSQEEVRKRLRDLVLKYDGVIVQLPLPGSFNQEALLAQIPRAKDVDVLSPEASAAFQEGTGDALVPPVPRAIEMLLAVYGERIKGKKVVLVGRGKLVGEPVGIFLKRAAARIVFVDKETEDMDEITRSADILISGAGVSGLITPEMVDKDAVVIDAGTSEAGGKLVGDVNPAVGEKVRLFAPVPGGVGPLTVAMLFVNLFELAGILNSQKMLQELKKKV